MGQTTIYNNGQPVTLPFQEITGQELRQTLSTPDERVLTVAENGRTRAIGDHERVQLREGTYLEDIPRFRYGAAFGSRAVAQRLAAETVHISAIYRQPSDFGFDTEVDQWWVRLSQFHLPPGWNYGVTPVLIAVNDRYPASGPDGFYLSKTLRDTHGQTPGHYFEERSAYNSYAQRGWAWFCIHPDWSPTVDVRHGDSIVKYLTLIHLALSQVVKPGFHG